MLDKTITNALLHLRAKIMREGLDGAQAQSARCGGKEEVLGHDALLSLLM
jgi:hypothetical protein